MKVSRLRSNCEMLPVTATKRNWTKVRSVPSNPSRLVPLPTWCPARDLVFSTVRAHTAGGFHLDDGLEGKDVGAATSEDQAEHGPDGEPLRDRLDEDASGQGHSPREDRALVVHAVHLGLLEGRRGIDDARARRRYMLGWLGQVLATPGVRAGRQVLYLFPEGRRREGKGATRSA